MKIRDKLSQLFYQRINNKFFKCFSICIGLVLLLLPVLKAQAQTAVQGIVVDTASNNPLVNVAVSLLPNSTGLAAVGKTTLTNRKGVFLFTNLTIGSYIIRIRVFNYAEKDIKINVLRNDDTMLLLGKIDITLRNHTLKEVNIIAQQLITQKMDRLVYNVEQDPQARVANVLTIMQKVPLLSVDGTDRIKYQGTDNYRILIDGKPSNFVAGNIKILLKDMPASNVKSIEVITSPSAKYLTEGVIGVINIVTNKRTENGYEGRINLAQDFPALGPAIGTSYTLKSGDFGVNLYGSLSDYHKSFTTTEINRTMHDSGHGIFKQTSRDQNYSDTKVLNGLFNYEVDSLNLLSLRFELYSGHQKNNSLLTAGLNNLSGEAVQHYDLEDLKKTSNTDFAVGFDYQRNFPKRKDKVLNFSYFLMNGQTDDHNRVMFAQQLNHTEDDYQQLNSYLQREHTTQIDYTQTIKKLKIEVGAKAIARLGVSDFSSFEDQNGVGQPDEQNSFNSNQYISTLYNSYQRQFKRLGFVGGYRLEYTQSEYNDQLHDATGNFTYWNFIPNVGLNFKLKGSNSLNFSYIKTIRRPDISYLNPFVDRSNPSLEDVGNPDLKPVKVNNLSLQYRRFNKTSMVLSLTHSFSSNGIQRVLIPSVITGVSRFTLTNIGKKSDFSTYLSYNVALHKSVNMNFSGTLTHSEQQGMINEVELEKDGFTGNVNFALNYVASKSLQLNGRFSYTAPSVLLQGKTTTYPYYIFTGYTKVWKDKIDLSGSILNPFSKLRTATSRYANQDFTQTTITESFYRRFQLTASYSFGQLQRTVRNNRKSISNTDAIGIK